MTEDDITEAVIAGFVKQILSGKMIKSTSFSSDFFCSLCRVRILALNEHCSFRLKAREHCMPQKGKI